METQATLPRTDWFAKFEPFILFISLHFQAQRIGHQGQISGRVHRKGQIHRHRSSPVGAEEINPRVGDPKARAGQRYDHR